jgi:UDP-3-O-[3-hydroxymyristoyl] glucosamine N-acyltransferase LpxD
MERKLSFRQLKEILSDDCVFVGNAELEFTGIQSVYECQPGDVTWIKPGVRDEKNLINQTVATCILCNKDSFKFFTGNIDQKLFVLHDDPKILYLRITKFFAGTGSMWSKPTYIHETAIIDARCQIGDNVKIGAYSVIGACEIGNGTIVGESVRIFDNVKIGSYCDIREFSSIGGQGLGYYKKADGTLERIPHIGSVVIEDNVHIYPFVNIDQGTLGTTRIGKGAAIDHHVHIGHNASVGMNSILVCGTVMAGGSKVLNDCFIGGNTQIRQKCIIGNRVITGMGSVVVKDIPDNEVWAGNPAIYMKQTPDQMF